MKVGLVACCSKKLKNKSLAKDLYQSTLFKSSMEYLNKRCDKIFILSAKYGLLELAEEIEPYNLTLNEMNKNERTNWSKEVLKKLKIKTDLQRDEYIILAGNNYREEIIKHIKKYDIPMEKLTIGKQLKFLKEDNNMDEVCEKLHLIANEMPRYCFPFEKDKICKNGIYILFEKGEKAHKNDRIVRIGTHRGNNNLYYRLKEHFINENKDRSIFRKNIGRALLNKNKDDYLEIWNIDFTKKENKKQFKYNLDIKKQENLEKQISKYIQGNLSFVIIEIPDKDSRLFFESKLISTVSLCAKCFPSTNWLGNYSSKSKIVESGLWLVNELYKEPFTIEELNKFVDEYIN